MTFWNKVRSSFLLSGGEGPLAVLILLLLPLLFLFPQNDWFFRLGDMDTSFHLGYMLNWDCSAPIFHHSNYHVARTPWLFPGFLAYHFLPPICANVVFHLLFYFLSIFSLFFIIKETVNLRAGLISSLLMGLYPFFWEAITSSYFHGAGITFSFLGILFLILARNKQHQEKFLFISGICAFSLVSLNPAFLLIIFIFLFIIRILSPKGSVLNPLEKLLFFFLGTIAGMLVLGLINTFYDFPFFAFWEALTFALTYKIPDFYFMKQVEQLTGATWLILPIFQIGIGGTIFCFQKIRNIPFGEGSYFVFLQIIFSLGIVFLSTRMISLITYFEYSAVYFIPITFLAIGSLLSEIKNASDRQFFLLVGILLFVFFFQFHFRVFDRLFPLNRAPLMVLIFVTVGYFGYVFFQNKSDWFTGIVCLIFCYLVIFNVTLPKIWEGGNRNKFLAIIKISQAIRKSPLFSSFSAQKDPLFWIDRNDPVCYAVANIFQSAERRMINPFPVEDWDAPHFKGQGSGFPFITLRPTAGNIAIIISQDLQYLDKAKKSLEKLKLDSQLLAEQQFLEGKVHFQVGFVMIIPSK